MTIKKLLALSICASAMLTGCSTYTTYNPNQPTYIAASPEVKIGRSRDWGAKKHCDAGRCSWNLFTRIDEKSNSLLVMNFSGGNLQLSSLFLSLDNYPSASFIIDGKVHITIDGEQTFSFDASGVVSQTEKMVPVIFSVPLDIEHSLIYNMAHGYSATIVFEGEYGAKYKMHASLMGFTKMLRLARQ